MIIKVKTRVFCEKLMSTETFTYFAMTVHVMCRSVSALYSRVLASF